MGEDLYKHINFICDFDKLVMLANFVPIEKYHSILCTKEYIHQNDFEVEIHIYEVSKIVEETGMRSFLNMIGTAATLDHFHTQVIYNRFNVEYLPVEWINNNIGYLQSYLGGNFLITGKIDERIRLLKEIIEHFRENCKEKTIKNDETISDFPLFTLMFWENNILIIPRKKETPLAINTMAGGMEIDGQFFITSKKSNNNTFEGIHVKTLINAIKEITFTQSDINNFILIKNERKNLYD